VFSLWVVQAVVRAWLALNPMGGPGVIDDDKTPRPLTSHPTWTACCGASTVEVHNPCGLRECASCGGET
jgi:hypothetical protein